MSEPRARKRNKIINYCLLIIHHTQRMAQKNILFRWLYPLKLKKKKGDEMILQMGVN